MIALLLLMSNPDFTTVNVDIIEHNTLWSIEVIEGAGPGGTNKLQWVKGQSFWNFWRFYGTPHNAYHVVDFKTVHAYENVSKNGESYVLVVNASRRKFRIIGRMFMETHCEATQDPERLDLVIWPDTKREKILGLRLTRLTDPSLSGRLLPSYKWSCRWQPTTVAADHSSTKSGITFSRMGSSVSAQQAARDRSISSPGVKESCSPFSARRTVASQHQREGDYDRMRLSLAPYQYSLNNQEGLCSMKSSVSEPSRAR